VDSLLGRQVRGVAWFDVPGRVERVEVIHHGVGSELGRAVWVGVQGLLGDLVTFFGTPQLGVAEEEPLRSGESVEDR
jgi:hypothetical protein